ncbi:MAG: hypothetical protein ACOX5F_11275 [Anaerovoracaceae bacterium]|jgi:hypothetical protein
MIGCGWLETATDREMIGCGWLETATDREMIGRGWQAPYLSVEAKQQKTAPSFERKQAKK